MKRYQITVNGRTFDVRLLSDPRQEQVQVEVDGENLTVEVTPVGADEQPRAEAPPRGTRPTASEAMPSSILSVTAPLPGVIKSILIQPGQRVAQGDHLLVIEAMKMNNVIRAPREGVIERVHVAEGHRVAHGDPMVKYRD
jgi:oxaloacetate decarboxylase alpha subunit